MKTEYLRPRLSVTHDYCGAWTWSFFVVFLLIIFGGLKELRRPHSVGRAIYSEMRRKKNRIQVGLVREK